MKFILKKITVFLIALSITFYTHIPARCEDGNEILKKALETEGMVDLSGFCYTASLMKPYEFSNNVKVFWKRPGKTRMEYFSGNILQMIVITTKDKSIEFSPAENIVYIKEISPQKKELEKTKQSLLFSNYEAKIAGKETVSGRDATLVKVDSRYPDRPSKKLWIDDKTGTILKSEQYSSSGNLIFLTYFKKINFNSVINDSFFMPPQGMSVRTVSEPKKKNFTPEDLSKLVGFKVVIPYSIPEGYVLEGCYVYQCGCGVDMAHMRFFDGLNSISIFEGKKDCPVCSKDKGMGFFRGRRGRMGMGRGRGMGCSPRECELLDRRQERVMAFTDKEIRFVIIGDIPESDANRIADGLKK
ncbi:MAG: hypothetical protein A2043_10425 [Candidatus Schekmanbacteria bacterium GWA2_38_9]|uniref:MucB/RseB N-terminal domain-containing protein n=1 Tax=Candidatus Schekmanbacteria bacterium RIFCSPLOWO2_12_FULL_38_15 TaxID=1817883 RepID=A0A1F7SEG6_9BACT|nr:MAG: hypothetical protein A2043_10425 [Candidatus Schekmanbacteria bacterium GWA2_38_9]OGL49475.1 MAG: hypothetical protein A3H37_10245 [Candidatus Schekmanbacteria bacterium RIFCSPLOWO2_02_FULL_38_14]OGL52160.1 MAG: hypothetical protein A3G31_07005 [Candidatus Schekmanbacteria bacterium RIFCSPLOWO2_12_FULL_38_15]